MKKITRIIVWLCSKFNKEEIENITIGLIDVLSDRNPEIKPKDDFKQKHPNYREFSVDPNPPLTKSDKDNEGEEQHSKHFTQLLKEYLEIRKKELKPVKHRNIANAVPIKTICPSCNAPHSYIYFNDGNKRTQLICKVCSTTFQLNKRFRSKTKYYCPYCKYALFKWKENNDYTIYKCGNKLCEHRKNKINNLNAKELIAHKNGSSQYKVNYQYREYHYKVEDLNHSSPFKPKVNLTKIHNTTHILSLVLTFHISFAMNATQTAKVLRDVFNIQISRQTVLNYAEAAAFYCHKFNFENKGKIDNISAGDETYIKVRGVSKYVWFFISAYSKVITAYHVAHTRNAKDAIITMIEAMRTKKLGQTLQFISDGNPSYLAGIHYINSLNKDSSEDKIQYHKVVGLQNLDEESATYRVYKQIIERLNRTYNYHNTSQGFRTMNGATVFTTLFVTHYNFLRPHISLHYNVPTPLDELKDLSTTPEKWAKILSLAS